MRKYTSLKNAENSPHFLLCLSSLRDEPSPTSWLKALVPQGTLSEVIKPGAGESGQVGLTHPHPLPTSLPREYWESCQSLTGSHSQWTFACNCYIVWTNKYLFFPKKTGHCAIVILFMKNRKVSKNLRWDSTVFVPQHPKGWLIVVRW